MMSPIPSQFVRVCAAAAGAGLLAAALALPSALAGPDGGMAQAKVDATYDISINGIGLGALRFNSNVTRDRYALESDVELSALLGMFKWRGITHTSGAIVADKPQPRGFQFAYEGTSRSGTVKMNFGSDGVDAVTVLPPVADPPDMVPLASKHLKSVLDPLTAIISLTHAAGESPCARSVPIFDGKQRFDIQLSFRRHVPASDTTHGPAIVCRVKYVPLGGYRANEETKALARSTGIEITFRPVPGARLMLPQEVVIPTVAGSVRLALVRVDIDTPASGRIAFVD